MQKKIIPASSSLVVLNYKTWVSDELHCLSQDTLKHYSLLSSPHNC